MFGCSAREVEIALGRTDAVISSGSTAYRLERIDRVGAAA
jgi:hypothetical protein